MSSKSNEQKTTNTANIESSTKVTLLAPSVDGGDREVKVVYKRNAVYERPSFLKAK